MKKEFCKPTTLVLAEDCDFHCNALKANSKLYLSGNNLANTHGNFPYCILRTSFRLIPNFTSEAMEATKVKYF